MVYGLILVIPFLFILKPPAAVIPLKLKFVETAVLPLKILSFPFQEIKKIISYHKTFREYQQLKREYETLKSRLVGLQEVLLENKRYEKLLDFRREFIFSSLVATVVGRDPSNWNAAMIIDKGKRDGLEVGLPVVSPLGVVGKIAEVTPTTSKVILLIDPNFSVAGLVQDSREGGLVSGTLQGICRMQYLSPAAEVKKGDTVITSHLSSSFPAGLLIGKVTAVYESQNSPGIECLVEPAVSFAQLEEVIVIRK